MANKDPKEILKETLETVEILKDSFNSLGAIIKNNITNNIVDANNVTKIYGKTLINDISRRLSSLGKQSENLIQNQNLLTIGQSKSKDIQEQIYKLDKKKLGLIDDINNAYKSDLISLNNKEILEGELIQKIKEEKDLLNKQLLISKKIEDTLGNTGKIVKGISKIPLIGQFADTNNIMESMQLTAAETGDKTLTMLSGMKAFGSSIKKSLLDPLTLITFFLNRAISTNKQSVEIGKQLGYGADNADRIQSNFRSIERLSNNLNVTTTNLNEAFNQLSESTGFVTEYSKDALETQIKLTKQLGLSGDEAAGIYISSILTGKSSEATYQSMLKGYVATRNSLKVGVPFKSAMAEAAKVTGQLSANMGYSLEKIIKGVVSTKALGTSLEQAKSQGESLLDFQSSIENELEAELITGQKLNLERARAAALMGDQVTVAEELAAQGMNANKFAQMNVIAQNSYAKALGTTSDELTNQLKKRELAIESGKSLAQITAEEVDEANRRQDIQTKFNAAIEKLQSIIGNLVAGPLGKFLEIIASILDNTVAMGVIFGVLIGSQIPSAIKGYKSIVGIIKKMAKLSIAEAVANAAASAAAIPGIGWMLAGAAAGGLGALLYTFLADDMVQTPGYGKRTILSPEGSIKLNDNDTIIAGTDLGLNNKRSQNSIGSPQINTTLDLSPLISAINEVKSSVDRLNNKSWDVYLDSSKVGRGIIKNQTQSV